MGRMQKMVFQRRFPTNLNNKLEEKLKNKSKEAREIQIQTEQAKKQQEEKRLVKCPKCGKLLDRTQVVKKKYICYECGGYFRVKNIQPD